MKMNGVNETRKRLEQPNSRIALLHFKTAQLTITLLGNNFTKS